MVSLVLSEDSQRKCSVHEQVKSYVNDTTLLETEACGRSDLSFSRLNSARNFMRQRYWSHHEPWAQEDVDVFGYDLHLVTSCTTLDTLVNFGTNMVLNRKSELNEYNEPTVKLD
jgi:hypothetical protein